MTPSRRRTIDVPALGEVELARAPASGRRSVRAAPLRHAEARRGRARAARARPAGARVAAVALALASGASSCIRRSGRCACSCCEGMLVPRRALALVVHRPVPVQAEAPRASAGSARRSRRRRAAVSRSSMRTSQRPPWWRASRKLPSGGDQRAEVQAPVGEGAKRPRRAGRAQARRYRGFSGSDRRGRRTGVHGARGAPGPRCSGWRPDGLRGA